MNFKLVLKLTGKTLLLAAATMLLPLLVAFYYGEDPTPFVYSIGLLLLVGGLFAQPKVEPHFFAREGFFSVGLIWVLFGVFGALPFWFSGY
ncbi:MAG: TrkH family potassium uptake protein, partial [Pygmaiobacter sp.]